VSIKSDVLNNRNYIYNDTMSIYRNLSNLLYQGFVSRAFFDVSNTPFENNFPEELYGLNNMYFVEQRDVDGNLAGHRRKKTINLTKLVSRHIRTLIMNEGYSINVKNDIEQGEKEKTYVKRNFFEKVLDNNNFDLLEGDLLEYAIATGDNLKLIYFDENETELTKKPKINYLKGDKFIITEHDNLNIKGVVITTTKIREEKNSKKGEMEKWYYTLLEHHKVDYDRYKVEREVYKSKSRHKLETACAWSQVYTIFGKRIEEETEVHDVNEPMFVFTKTPFANNKVKDSIRGIGITINALSEMETVNNGIDAEDRELYLTMAKIIAPESFIQHDLDPESGKMVRRFNQNTEVFLAINDNDSRMEKPEIFAPPLRTQGYETVIENSSKRFAKSVGLDPNYFHLNPQSKATATQVKIENKASHDLRQEIISVLKKTWEDLLYIIYKYSKYLNLIDWELEKEDISITFKDGVVEDDAELFKRDLQMLEKGIVSKEYIRIRWTNMNKKESETEQEVIEIENRLEITANAVEKGVLSPRKALKMFNDEEMKPEDVLYEYINIELSKGNRITPSEYEWYHKETAKRENIELLEETNPESFVE